MNNRQFITVIVVAIAALAAGFFIGKEMGGVKSEKQITLKTQDDSLNYFLGLNMGYSFSEIPWEMDEDLIVSGIFQVVKDSSAFSQMTAQAILQELNMRMTMDERNRSSAAAEENLQKGLEFLEENGKKEGIVTTESGLQYEVIEEGTGPKPEASSMVSVMYEGSLIDGTVFESSFETNDTVRFRLDGVIEGWTEGVQLMNVGSVYRFFIPANMAYGPRDSGPIPGNSVLIFKIELLDFE